jgi:hypothetical protein
MPLFYRTSLRIIITIAAITTWPRALVTYTTGYT